MREGRRVGKGIGTRERAGDDVPTIPSECTSRMVGTPPDAFASGCFAHPTIPR
jgi:hypothetical protein